MADGYALALQKALVLKLRGDATVSALVGTRIYDQPPDSPTRPFIRIGAIEPRPMRSSCSEAAGVTFGIEAYSRPAMGRVEATRCAEAVSGAISDQTLTLEGFRNVTTQWITQTVNPDGDDKSYTAIVVFNSVLEADS